MGSLTRLGVAGWPVAHSRSPSMHNAALEAVGLDRWRYQRLPLAPELFAEAVRALPGVGFAGINVTIPHKEAALALADEATPEARAIGAVNTLTFRPDGSIHGQNTDAPGFLAALPAPPTGATALVLGAGGSARAVAFALREAGAAHVRVWNRTPERAREVARDLGVEATDTVGPADLLVNCTSVGLTDGEFKDLPLGADGLSTYATVADLVYRDGGTALIAEARGLGCAVVDGLEVLVRQGALSFEAWTGHVAPIDAMREGARGEFPDRHDPRKPNSPQARHGRADGG